jgi:hypothetical protein
VDPRAGLDTVWEIRKRNCDRTNMHMGWERNTRGRAKRNEHTIWIRYGRTETRKLFQVKGEGGRKEEEHDYKTNQRWKIRIYRTNNKSLSPSNLKGIVSNHRKNNKKYF